LLWIEVTRHPTAAWLLSRSRKLFLGHRRRLIWCATMTALINMAVNARDAMNGEGTLTVSARGVSGLPPVRGHAGSAGDFVAVSVSDTGAGIPSDMLAHIFDPFFTTKAVGKGDGARFVSSLWVCEAVGRRRDRR
jgi:signal transduction histidine kinase